MCPLQHRHGPAQIEKFIRRKVGGRFKIINLFRFDFIKRNDLMPSAPLDGPGAVPFVGQQMSKRGQQESPEFSFLRVNGFKVVLFEQTHEKLLGHILRICFAITLSPDKSI